MCSKFLPKTHQTLPLFPPSSRQKNSASLGRSWVGGLCRVVEKDSDRESEFDIDQDKAREALRQLDQKLESFSKKKIPSPKIRVIKPSMDGPDYAWEVPIGARSPPEEVLNSPRITEESS